MFFLFIGIALLLYLFHVRKYYHPQITTVQLFCVIVGPLPYKIKCLEAAVVVI